MYSRYLFPCLMDFGMRFEPFTRYRRRILAGLSGEGLEIGAGTGLNFKHYPPEVAQLNTVDPNPGMEWLSGRRAAKATVSIRRGTLSAEILPFGDGYFDFVVSTWTLCSIPEVERALSEVYRVLKPGGEFRFVEHGLAPDENVRRWQHRLTPVQKIVADGCHLNRDMAALVDGAGFEMANLETFYLSRSPKSVGYFYLGRATKKL
jgi:ubiquinone/menaquinone biosynthesis C-methylase UbiE